MRPVKKIAVIQYLRGIAALAVVVSHIASMQTDFGISAPEVFPRFVGFWGVDIFFVISGFIIVHITQDVQPTANNAARFLSSRIIRIVPAYWFFTLLMFAMEKWGIWGDPENSKMTAMMLLKSMLFIKPGFPLLFVGWTLTLEMFFYLVFSALICFFCHKYRVYLCCSLFSILVLLPVVIDTDGRYFRFYTQTILLEFVAGILIAFSCRYGSNSAILNRLALPVGIVILLAVTLCFSQDTLIYYRAFFWGIPSILIFMGCLFGIKGFVSEFLDKIGGISYSLYLCHIPCTYLSMKLIRSWQPEMVNPNLVMCILALVFSLAVAAISYLVFESFLVRFLRRIFLAEKDEHYSHA